jgi:hypothetical protein
MQRKFNDFIVKVKLIGSKNYFCHIIVTRMAIIAKVNRSMKMMIGKIGEKKMKNLEEVHRIHTLRNYFAVALEIIFSLSRVGHQV